MTTSVPPLSATRLDPLSHGDRPHPRRSILEIKPYVPGKSSVTGEGKVHKLSSNESPLGPSPAAVEAMKAAAETLALYPDPGATKLREAIGRRYGLDPERVVCSAGSDELIALLCHAFLHEGDEMIQTRHGFNIYAIAALTAGGKPVFTEEKDLTADVDAILAAVTPRTRLVFIANPNNPTGTYVPFADLKRLAEGLPMNVVLVIDAAYAEYVRRNDYSSGLELAATMPNVVMIRTFSKIHGLAALRIGWLYGPAEIVSVLHRIRGPFNVSGPAIAAAAAAMDDVGHVERSVDHNETLLPWYTDALRALGLEVTPSAANFVLVHFPDEDGRRAVDADKALQEARIIVRRMESYFLPNALRITIGSEEALRATLAVFARLLGRD